MVVNTARTLDGAYRRRTGAAKRSGLQRPLDFALPGRRADAQVLEHHVEIRKQPPCGTATPLPDEDLRRMQVSVLVCRIDVDSFSQQPHGLVEVAGTLGRTCAEVEKRQPLAPYASRRVAAHAS